MGEILLNNGFSDCREIGGGFIREFIRRDSGKQTVYYVSVYPYPYLTMATFHKDGKIIKRKVYRISHRRAWYSIKMAIWNQGFEV